MGKRDCRSERLPACDSNVLVANLALQTSNLRGTAVLLSLKALECATAFFWGRATHAMR